MKRKEKKKIKLPNKMKYTLFIYLNEIKCKNEKKNKKRVG